MGRVNNPIKETLCKNYCKSETSNIISNHLWLISSHISKSSLTILHLNLCTLSNLEIIWVILSFSLVCYIKYFIDIQTKSKKLLHYWSGQNVDAPFWSFKWKYIFCHKLSEYFSYLNLIRLLRQAFFIW